MADNKLRVIGKNIHLNIGEQEWLGHMQKMYNLTEQEALAEIIEYKREQAFGYGRAGHYELERQLLIEIDEWDDQHEQDYKNKVGDTEDKTIILLGEQKEVGKDFE